MTETLPADKRLDWCEKNIRVKGRRPFRVKGIPERNWVRDFYRALEGFKAWPVNDDFESLCEECSELAETIVDHPDDLCPCDDCPGLYAEPILFIFLAGDRRTGKTASFFSSAIEQATNEKNFEALYLATTDDQTKELSKDHLVNTIEANGMLQRKWSLATSQNKYAVRGKRSLIRVSAPTMKAAGKGVELLGIDEARAFPGDILAVLLPTILDTHGVKCMTCRRKIYGEKDYHIQCPTDGCDGRLRRFFGRVVFCSNAPIIKDDPQRDWYADIIRSFQHDGIGKNEFVFNLDDSAKHNPDVATETKSAAIELMKRSPGLRPFIASEFENRDTRSGEDWLADYEIDDAIDKLWQPINPGEVTGRVIGFFDTSDVTDLSSIFLFEDRSPPGSQPFDTVRIVNYWIWDPADELCPVVTEGTIDEHKVYKELSPILRQYPRLAYFGVDIRWRTWAQRLVKKIARDKKNYPQGHKVHGFTGWGEERNIGWDELQIMLTSDRLKLPPEGRLISELKNARVVMKKGYLQVREANRRILHLDLAENCATCAYICFMMSNRTGLSFGQSNSVNSQRVRRKSAHGYGGNKAMVRKYKQRGGRSRFKG